MSCLAETDTNKRKKTDEKYSALYVIYTFVLLILPARGDQ